MWIMLSDCFFSMVNKDCPKDSLLVRARRPGDIEKVFGQNVKVTRSTDSDYLFRAIVAIEQVEMALQRAAKNIDYENFKDSVEDHALHLAYMKVWSTATRKAALRGAPDCS